MRCEGVEGERNAMIHGEKYMGGGEVGRGVGGREDSRSVLISLRRDFDSRSG